MMRRYAFKLKKIYDDVRSFYHLSGELEVLSPLVWFDILDLISRYGFIRTWVRSPVGSNQKLGKWYLLLLR
jgi:hypothetical protein